MARRGTATANQAVSLGIEDEQGRGGEDKETVSIRRRTGGRVADRTGEPAMANVQPGASHGGGQVLGGDMGSGTSKEPQIDTESAVMKRG